MLSQNLWSLNALRFVINTLPCIVAHIHDLVSASSAVHYATWYNVIALKIVLCLQSAYFRKGNFPRGINIQFPFIPFLLGQSRFFHIMSHCPGFISDIPFFNCTSVTISIDNRSVTGAILCNWHFYNDVNTPGG
jgi:hypothetical protein